MTADQYRPGQGEVARDDAQEPPRHRYLTLPSTGHAAEQARQAAREALASWQLGDLAETAVLLVSELVTNALRHARAGVAPIALRLEARGNSLRIEVQDADPRWPQPRTPAGLDESGFGLVLVDALASKWGVCEIAEGKAVWAELDAREQRLTRGE